MAGGGWAGQWPVRWRSVPGQSAAIGVHVIQAGIRQYYTGSSRGVHWGRGRTIPPKTPKKGEHVTCPLPKHYVGPLRQDELLIARSRKQIAWHAPPQAKARSLSDLSWTVSGRDMGSLRKRMGNGYLKPELGLSSLKG